MSMPDATELLEMDTCIAGQMERMPNREPERGTKTSPGGWWCWNERWCIWKPHRLASTDWSAAGEVLLRIRQQTVETREAFYSALAEQWRAWANAQTTEGMTEEEWAEIHIMTGTSRWFVLHADVPLAICLAALKVSTREENQNAVAM